MQMPSSRARRTVTMTELDDGTFYMTIHDFPWSVGIITEAEVNQYTMGMYWEHQPTGRSQINVDIQGRYGDRLIVARSFEDLMDNFRKEAGADFWGREQPSLPPSRSRHLPAGMSPEGVVD